MAKRRSPAKSKKAEVTPRWQRALPALLIVLSVFVIYLPALRAGFVWDDEPLITKNPLLRGFGGLGEIWSGQHTADYFPLTNSLFWLQFHLFRLNAGGYHLVNIFLHAANALLVWRVLLRLEVPGAWLAGVLFGIHPVHVESVAWISELKNTLSFFFCALAAWAWLRFENPPAEHRRLFYGAALFFFICACLAKTQVVVFPALLLLLAWWRSGAGSFLRREILRTLPFFAVALILGLVTIWFQRRGLEGEVIMLGSVARRLANAGAAVCWYFSKAVAPISLTTVYRSWAFDAPGLGDFLPAVLVGGSAIALFFWGRRNFWARAGFVTLAFFIILLLPVLGLFSMAYARSGTIVADHFQYFSDVSVLAFLAAAITCGWRAAAREMRFALALFIILLTTSAGIYSYQRAGVYRDEETLWRDNFAKNPDTWQGHNRIGQRQVDAGNFPSALEHLQRAAELKPELADNHNALGLVLCRLERFDEGIAEYRRALALKNERNLADAGAAIMHMNLANALAYVANNSANPNYDEAIHEYEAALLLTPGNAAAHRNLGIVLARSGRAGEAIRHLRKTVELAPDDSLAREALQALAPAGER